MRTTLFGQLATSDLFVDAKYEGGRFGNAADDPLPSLLRVDSQGGFRYRGKVAGKLHILVLTSSLADPDWPDSIDRETGVFTYYGDNKKPGRELHDTAVTAISSCRRCSTRPVREWRDDVKYRPPSSSAGRARGGT